MHSSISLLSLLVGGINSKYAKRYFPTLHCCKICKREFKTANGLKKHNTRLHQKRIETDALAAQPVDSNNHTIHQINITDNDNGQTKVKWGRAENIEEVRSMVLEAHKTICQWKKTHFPFQGMQQEEKSLLKAQDFSVLY